MVCPVLKVSTIQSFKHSVDDLSAHNDMTHTTDSCNECALIAVSIFRCLQCVHSQEALLAEVKIGFMGPFDYRYQ